MHKRELSLLSGACLLLTLLLYFTAWRAPFIYDDIDQILLNPVIQNPRRITELFTGGLRQSRMIMNLSFMLNWLISGREPWSYHLLNIGLHLGNALLLRRFLNRALVGFPLAAFLGFAFFLIHPLQIESVTYIMGRVSLLECLAYLTALNLCLDRKHPVALGLILLVAPLMKETGLLLPLGLVAYHWTIGGERFRSFPWRQSWFYGLPLIFVPLWLFWNPALKAHDGVVGFHLFPAGEYFLVQMHFLLFRLKLLFFPADQSIIHEYPAFTSEIALSGMSGLLMLAGIGALVILLRRRRPEASFFLALFLITMAPIGTVLQFVNPFAEYRLYLSNISVFCLMGLGIEAVVRRINSPQLGWLAAAALLIFFGAFNLQYNLLWAQPDQLVSFALDHYPHSFRLQSMLGGILEEKGAYPEAEKAYLESDRLNASYGRVRTLRPRMLLIQLHEKMGQWEKARHEIEDLPMLQIRARPLAFFQHYLRILRALHDEAKFQNVLREGALTFTEGELLELVKNAVK